MTQSDRDRLLVLKKAQKELLTQRQAATELDVTERHVRRLLSGLKSHGDASVIHGLRGRPSNRKLSEEVREKIVGIVSKEYPDFGPTLAREYLAQRHKVRIGREALRQVMMSAGLWCSRQQKVEAVHQWRTRRSCRGELVQWDTSEPDWLEGRGEKLYLIAMIDDATSELMARFAPHDSTAENMRLLWAYRERNGRPAAFYTDKASLFQTAPKVARDVKQLPRDERERLPPTQIGRALRELGMVWIAAHSPQAKGRIERSFGTTQDRLVKGLRVAGASTLAEANRYLEQEFLPWWNQHLVVAPANATDGPRPLGAEHDLAAALSHVETRQVAQRLHHPLERQNVSDCPRRHLYGSAGWSGSHRMPAGWFPMGSFSGAVYHGKLLPLASGICAATGHPAAADGGREAQAQIRPAAWVRVLARKPEALAQWQRHAHVGCRGFGSHTHTRQARLRLPPPLGVAIQLLIRLTQPTGRLNNQGPSVCVFKA